jgi:hypothetical protein
MDDVSRRSSLKLLAAGVGIMVFGKKINISSKRKGIRLGGPLFAKWETPDEWALLHQQLGYAAALCPCTSKDPEEKVQAYQAACRRHDLVIAEVGAWSNPLSPDPTARAEAVHNCMEQLELAERIGACCCVNISGSRGEQWDGPHVDNLTAETFDMIVQTTRTIIDGVKPERTYLPWRPCPGLIRIRLIPMCGSSRP